jgi:membrane-associated phospholipid phosphatase
VESSVLRRGFEWLLAISLLSFCSTSLATSALQTTGDVLEILIPATGLGATFLYADPQGRWQWLYSGATTLGTVEILKPLTEKIRPNGTTTTSFPSGHTASAFWGAAFLNTRYGPWWGVPAYGLAALTGYSRIRTDAHFADDVLAGASIALLSNWYWVRPLDDKLSFAPMTVPGGFGLKVQVADTSGVERGDRIVASLSPIRYRFEFEIAAADISYNKNRAPGAGGTTFDVANFENVNDTTTTAIVKFNWYAAPRQSLQFIAAPFEARNGGSFSYPVTFAGTTYPANQQLTSSYIYYDFRAIYRYELVPDSALISRVGAGISAQRTSLQLSGADVPTSDRVEKWAALPIVYGELGVSFARHWELVGEASGMWISGEKLLDGSVALRYRFNDHWDVAAGYRYYGKQTDSTQLYNSVAYRVPYVGIAHSW